MHPLRINLDTLRYDRNILYDKSPALARQKVKSFMAGRGCPYSCSYCFNGMANALHRGLGQMVRQHSPKYVVNEIMEVRARWPLEVVRFMDDNFTIAPLEWIREFRFLYKHNVGLPFFCMGRFNLLTTENVALLREAGCVSMYCAIEAGNERVRNEIANRNQSREQILTGAKLLHDNGIRLCAENIIGFPTETISEMFETVKLNIDAGVDCALVSVLNPFPGTQVEKIARERGLLTTERLPDSFYEATPLNYTPADKKRIARLRGLFNLMVAFPALYRLRWLLVNLPLAPVYDLAATLLHMYLMRFRISPVRMTVRETLETIWLFLKMRRNEQ